MYNLENFTDLIISAILVAGAVIFLGLALYGLIKLAGGDKYKTKYYALLESQKYIK
jgi:hypothetical protein